MRKEYNSQIYFVLKAFSYAFISWILFIAVFALISIELKIKALFLIAFIASLTLPFAYQKKFKNIFTKRAFLTFDDTHFSIVIYNKEDEKVKEIIYNWNEIKAYKFYFTASKLTYMDIYLKNGSCKEFGFKDNKTEDESINSESVFSIFYSFVKAYNINKQGTEKINFVSGLFAKPIGIILLCVLAVLIVVDIILHILKYDNNIGFIIFGAAIFLGLVTKRIQQKKFYERISKLD